MGRYKPKREARRSQRRAGRVVQARLPEEQRFSSVGESMHDGSFEDRPDGTRSTVGMLVTTYMGIQRRDPDGPACGGPLLVHADGSFQCTAGCPGGLKVVHLPEALHYCDHADRLGIHADELGHLCTACTALGEGSHDPMFSACTGTELDHEDGAATCSLGDACQGIGLPHATDTPAIWSNRASDAACPR